MQIILDSTVETLAPLKSVNFALYFNGVKKAPEEMSSLTTGLQYGKSYAIRVTLVTQVDVA